MIKFQQMALESNLADLINDYIIKMGWGKLDEADRWERKNNLENRELGLNNRERRSEEYRIRSSINRTIEHDSRISKRDDGNIMLTGGNCAWAWNNEIHNQCSITHSKSDFQFPQIPQNNLLTLEDHLKSINPSIYDLSQNFFSCGFTQMPNKLNF